MLAVVSKQDELGRLKLVCNSSDITETSKTGYVEAAIAGVDGHHGDEMTCIETGNVYLYDATKSKWVRPSAT